MYQKVELSPLTGVIVAMFNWSHCNDVCHRYQGKILMLDLFRTAVLIVFFLPEAGEAQTGADFTAQDLIEMDEHREICDCGGRYFPYLRCRAEQGDEGAQFNLAKVYHAGEAGPQDNVAAHMWFNISAANAGNGDDYAGYAEDAAKSRDRIETFMTREQISEAQKSARICMESGYEDCLGLRFTCDD